jgi:hypothetical protein
MKLVSATVFLVLVECLASGASPDEEFSFLNRVRVAYMTTNVDAIMALHCWDGIPQRSKENYRVQIKVQFLDRPSVDTVWYGSHQFISIYPPAFDGKVPNLKPVKYIRVQFQPVSRGVTKENVPIIETGYEELPVGEKNGKLMLAFYIPAIARGA